jgi:hypothetical protein
MEAWCVGACDRCGREVALARPRGSRVPRPVPGPRFTRKPNRLRRFPPTRTGRFTGLCSIGPLLPTRFACGPDRKVDRRSPPGRKLAMESRDSSTAILAVVILAILAFAAG